MRRTVRIRHLGLAGLCCGVGLLASSLLQAQQPGAEPAARQLRQTRQHQAGQKQFCLGTELIGMEVKAKGGEECGQIRNLIIDPQGEVRYLALSTDSQGVSSAADRAQQPGRESPQESQQSRTQPGATAVSGGKFTLVPWDAVEFHAGANKAQAYASLNIEKDRLMQAPSFTEQQLTDARGQAQLIAQVDQFFNVQRRGAARPDLNRERTDQEREGRQPTEGRQPIQPE